MNPKAWVEAVFELIWRIAVRTALAAGLVFFLLRVRSVIADILLAAVLAYAIIPIVDFLCSYKVRGMSRKFQRFVATLVVFVLLGSITVALSVAFFAPLEAEFQDLIANSKTYLGHASKLAKRAHRWYAALPPDVQDFLQTQRFENTAQRVEQWGRTVFKTTFNLVAHLLDIVLIPVLAFYFTLDSRTLKREFVGLAPRRRTREALAIAHELNCIMRSYVIGQIILCLIAGLVVAGVLRLLEMPYVLILSVFAGVTRAVPIIGPIVSGLAIIFFGLAKAPIIALNLLVFFALMHFAESKFIMPKLIGDRMKLHPAVIIIVLLIGAEFFGILGMFLAAPVAALLRVLVRYYLIKPKELRVWGLSRQRRCAPGDAQPGAETLVSAAGE